MIKGNISIIEVQKKMELVLNLDTSKRKAKLLTRGACTFNYKPHPSEDSPSKDLKKDPPYKKILKKSSLKEGTMVPRRSQGMQKKKFI